jgi:hypothetical protein
MHLPSIRRRLTIARTGELLAIALLLALTWQAVLPTTQRNVGLVVVGLLGNAVFQPAAATALI